MPQFAVSIGFVVDGGPQVSVVFNPAQERFYKAAAGQGAFLNDQAIRVTPRSDIDGALLLVSRSEPQKKFQVFADRCDIEPVGSIAYRLAKVAGGDGDATFTFRTIHEWDICAGVLMVLEAAGGKVVDGDGEAMKFNRQLPEASRRGSGQRRLSGGLQGMWARGDGWQVRLESAGACVCAMCLLRRARRALWEDLRRLQKASGRVAELRGKVGYGQFLDGLEETGVDKEKILKFLKADPDGATAASRIR